MSYPEISVIIPTYNSKGSELVRAVRSVLAQAEFVSGELAVEIIVVNDASDSTFLPGLEKLAADYLNIRLLHHEKQSGPAGARNYGIRMAKGRLVGFLDADDEWPVDKIALLIPFFQTPEIEVAGGKVKYIVEDRLPSPILKYEDDEQRLTHVHLGTLLVRKPLFDKGFYFDETLIFSEDVDWWLRLRENNTGIALTEGTTLLYHVHGQNMSVNKKLDELQVLEILHNSLLRRRSGDKIKNIPQVKDFRTQRTDPLISIVLPLYNGKKLVKKALDGVLSQTFSNWELCIIDDGSTDGGAEWITAYYPSARIFKQKNTGVAAARNKGIEVSGGDVIAFLDQDDEWLPAKLAAQWEVLKRDPYCAFVTCNQQFVCYEGVSLPAFFNERLKEEHRGFVPSALLVRKHVLLSVGKFDESLEICSDYDLIRRLRKASFREENVNSLLLRKWYHESNASFNTPQMRREFFGLLHKQLHGK